MKDEKQEFSSPRCHPRAGDGDESVMTAPGDKVGSRAAEQDVSVRQMVRLS